MVSFTVLPRSIVVGINGKRFDVKKEDARFEKVLALIKTKHAAGEEISDEDMSKLIDPEAMFGSEEGVSLKKGVVYIGDEAMPPELSLRIIELKKQEIPIKNLLNFWNNLKENTSMNSVQQLYKFLEHNGHPITADGCFIAYRAVREDFKDFHTGTMDNSVGKTLEMPRNKVNDNSSETCSHGLHVASWEYAKDFGGAKKKMIEVKVNPKDVVCVPDDYNNTKMRVCKFEVLAEIEQERTEAFVNTGIKYGNVDLPEDEFDHVEKAEDTVLELAEEHSNYEGDALVTRISEDCDLDEETIRSILEEHDLI